VDTQSMDPDTPETLAGVGRLLARAADLLLAEAQERGPRSALHMLANGTDLAADEARNLVPPGFPTLGPVPVGNDPSQMLRSAERLLAGLPDADTTPGLVGLRARVADLVWDAYGHARG
jgi:hypothetical protein